MHARVRIVCCFGRKRQAHLSTPCVGPVRVLRTETRELHPPVSCTSHSSQWLTSSAAMPRSGYGRRRPSGGWTSPHPIAVPTRRKKRARAPVAPSVRTCQPRDPRKGTGPDDARSASERVSQGPLPARVFGSVTSSLSESGTTCRRTSSVEFNTVQ